MKNFNHSGFGLLSAMLTVAVLTTATVSGYHLYSKAQRVQTVQAMIDAQAFMMAQFTRAADEYIKDKSGALADDSALIVGSATLVSDGYLPDAYNATTPFGATLSVYAYKDAAGTTRHIVTGDSSVTPTTLAAFDLSSTADGSTVFYNRIAVALEKRGLISGVLQPGTSVAKGTHERFDKDIAEYTGIVPGARAVVFSGFEDLEASSSGSGTDVNVNVAPYTRADLLASLKELNLGLRITRQVSYNDPGNNQAIDLDFAATVYSNGTQLLMDVSCNSNHVTYTSNFGQLATLVAGHTECTDGTHILYDTSTTSYANPYWSTYHSDWGYCGSIQCVNYALNSEDYRFSNMTLDKLTLAVRHCTSITTAPTTDGIACAAYETGTDTDYYWEAL